MAAKNPLQRKKDLVLLRYLLKIAVKAVKKFDLKLKRFGILERDSNDKETLYGLCYPFKKEIYIRLRSERTGRLYCKEHLIDTTLHEVAHLRHPHDCHSRRFWKLYSELLDWYYSEKK